MEIETKEQQAPVEIPQEVLSSEALRGIIEGFILREGTDYGIQEASFESKYQQILKQLNKKEVKIVFDPNTETVSLMTVAEWKKLQK